VNIVQVRVRLRGLCKVGLWPMRVGQEVAILILSGPLQRLRRRQVARFHFGRSRAWEFGNRLGRRAHICGRDWDRALLSPILEDGELSIRAPTHGCI
jgi:hypothetical protein